MPLPVYDLLKKVKRRMGGHTELSLLLQNLLQDLPDFTFVQVGANDGVSTDPYREFILDGVGTGILVEPSPRAMTELQRNYRCRPHLLFEQAAVSYRSSTVVLHLPEDASASGVASLSEAHARAHAGDRIRSLPVPALRIEDLLDKHGLPRVDCLFLDVEGLEAEILLAVDLDRLGARVISYESAHLGTERDKVWQRLEASGYSLREVGMDTVAWRH
jgi:FkbM family methyltransferase